MKLSMKAVVATAIAACKCSLLPPAADRIHALAMGILTRKYVPTNRCVNRRGCPSGHLSRRRGAVFPMGYTRQQQQDKSRQSLLPASRP